MEPERKGSDAPPAETAKQPIMQNSFPETNRTYHEPVTAERQPSDITKDIITATLLLLFYPAGVLVMWFWVKWPRWVKILISVPVILAIVALFVVLYFTFAHFLR
jgi:fatty acid desaturase